LIKEITFKENMNSMITNLNQLLDKAQKTKTKILAIAAAEDKYVMNAIAKAKQLNLVKPVYIGSKEKILNVASEMGVSINENEIIDQPDVNNACIEAVKMVSEGKADLLMKGLVSTGVLLKQVVSKDHGLLSGNLLSHLAVFESPNYHKLLGLTDAAMNISPSLEEKAAILKNAVNAFHLIGCNTPKAAVLAAVEKVNPKIKATTDAVELKKMNISGCIVDGPFALDNAVSKEAAAHKNIEGDVAGDADILLAPDLNTGNALYKSLSFLGNARCAAIIVGSKAPIVLTSRADTEETKFLSIALGVLTSK
jgi:phosphate butyryltransferase